VPAGIRVRRQTGPIRREAAGTCSPGLELSGRTFAGLLAYHQPTTDREDVRVSSPAPDPTTPPPASSQAGVFVID